MGFGNLGVWEILVIALIVLVVFGPRRLPEIARSLGRAMREFRRGVNEIQRELEEAERGPRLEARGGGRPGGSRPVASPEVEPRDGEEAGREAGGEGEGEAGPLPPGAPQTDLFVPPEP